MAPLGRDLFWGFHLTWCYFFAGSGEVLEIGSLESSDAGTYQCRATNTAGVLNSRSATLTVSQFTGECVSDFSYPLPVNYVFQGLAL